MTVLFRKEYLFNLNIITDLRVTINSFCQQLGCEQEIIDSTSLVISEYLSNIFFHNPDDVEKITIELNNINDNYRLDIIDSGSPFDPLKADSTNLFTDELLIGGMGLSLIQSNNKNGDYRSFGGVNTFSIPISKGKEKSRIVIVDDDVIMLKVTEKLLSSDYLIETYTDAREALKYIEHAGCDLIIADIHMPLMSGFDFRNKVKMTDKGILIPFIFLTGDRNQHIHTEATDLFIDALLEKPVGKETLLLNCNIILNRSKQLAINYQDKLTESIGKPFKPSLPIIAGNWHFALSHTPASMGGGDFVFHHKESDYQLLIVGDIMGHGPVAKYQSYSIIGYLNGLIAVIDHSPAQMMTTISSYLYKNKLLETSLLTCVIVKLYNNGQCEIVTAGHPSPYLISPLGFSKIDCEGSLLGLFSQEYYDVTKLKINTDKYILIYSDGLYECVNPINGEIDDLAGNVNMSSTSAVLNSIWNNFEAQLTTELRDDVTAIVIGCN